MNEAIFASCSPAELSYSSAQTGTSQFSIQPNGPDCAMRYTGPDGKGAVCTFTAAQIAGVSTKISAMVGLSDAEKIEGPFVTFFLSTGFASAPEWTCNLAKSEQGCPVCTTF
jgi:hypothetical protein